MAKLTPFEKAIRLLKKAPLTPKELFKKLKITPTELELLLYRLVEEFPGIQKSGKTLFIYDPRLRPSVPLDFTLDPKEETGKIGIISCTHFGSKYAQITHLHHFYARCKDEGVSTVFHCGDLVDGDGRIYRGQRYEMHLQGIAEQRDFVVSAYPKIGIPTKIISGNHDESFAMSAGVDIVADVVKERKDLDYLGRYAANLFIAGGKVKVKLHHGEGGNAYAASYKGQKYIETFTSENKPQVYVLGHYHTFIQMFRRNIHFFQLGCFQAQTPYLVRKMLSPELGGWIIEYSLDPEDGWSLSLVKAGLVPFYKVIKDDWKNWV